MTNERTGPSRRLIVSLAVVVGAAAAFFIWTGVDRDNQAAERDQAVDGAQQYASALSQVCTTIPLAADRLGDMCSSAAEVAENPEVVVTQGPSGPAGPQGRPPTAGEIRAAVGAVFASSPTIPEGSVQRAVVDYLTTNPPAPGEAGRPPTPEEVEVAVAAYCAGDACQGDPGADSEVPGPQGPPPTDEQIAAAVAAFCTADGQCPTEERIDQAVARYCGLDTQPCRGDDGEDSTVPGPPGPSCPEGYEPGESVVHVRVGETEEWVDAILCLPEGGENPPTVTPDPTGEPE